MANVPMGQNYLAWDNTQPVTVVRTRAAGGQKAPVAIAKRRAITRKEKSPSGGVYQGFEAAWWIPVALLPPGWSLAPGYAVNDGTTLWTVLTADLVACGADYKLGCVNLTLAMDLRDAINIERAALTYDAAGAAVKTFPTQADGSKTTGGLVLYAGLAARVQLIEATIAEERGIRGPERAYDVIVDGQVDDVREGEDRVLWGGVILDIIRLRNPERIDELPVLECKQKV